MKELSVFVDESGDFGEYEDKSPYYLVAMVFHDQNKDIYEDIKTLDRHIIELGFPIHAIHSGPIIRNESIYKDNYSDLDNRRALLNSLYNFTRKVAINYICPCIEKKGCKDSIQLNAKLSREIASNLLKHKDYLDTFEKLTKAQIVDSEYTKEFLETESVLTQSAETVNNDTLENYNV